MKDYQKKLLNYSSLATGIITLGLGDAQVIYTDIYPDIMLFDEMDEIGMQYLDFNIDGVNDIGLSFTTHYGCGYCPTQVFFNLDLTGSNNIAADLAGPCYLSSTYTSSTVCIIPAQNVAKVFAEGEIVSEFNSWDQIDEIFDSNKCGMFGGGCIQGEFDFNSPKQFLAFQIINIDTNYCWLRLAWEGESLFMKDFACSSTPDDSIFIQDKIADEVRDLVLIKDSCTGGTDELKVKFKPPLDEETVSEYRIMVAPSYGFNPNSALIVAPENYVSVLPTGNDIEIRLPKNFPNYLGEELPPFTDIKITVVSISKFPITNECSLVRSLPAQFGLDSYPETPDDLSLTATTLAYDPSDLFLSHEEVFDTSQSSAFRIFIVNGVEWYDFSLAEAEAIAPANYIEIPPLFNFNFQLPENMKRWNGDAMEPDTYYRAFILVMYKDGIKCANKLSDVSNYASFKANPNSIENVLQDFNIFYREDLIVISSVRSIQGTVCVFDLKGALVFENEIFANDIKIPFAQPPGIYIVKLETETGIYRQKNFRPMRNDRSGKMLNYSALALGFLAANNSEAQIVYTDVEPDILLYSLEGGWLEDEGMQYIDFNFDGNIDIGLSFHTAYDCGYCPTWTFFNLELYGSNKIAVEFAEACYLSSTFGSGYSSTECIIPGQNVARVFVEGDTISEFIDWDQITDIFETHICGYYGEDCTQGEYDFHASKQFLGFQIIDTDTNYCWLRLGWNDDSLYINDFACSSAPADIITVKDKIADAVHDLVLYTDSCTSADELKVQFKKALDEETVSEYRIMVTPGYGFSANEALLISPENYLSVLPTGNDIDIRLPKNFTNYIGDELPILSDIKITVFSISKFPFSNECSMVISNPAQIGVNSFPETPTEVNLISTEVAYNSSDISVSIDELIDTTVSSKFRIMMILGSVWDEFTLENAESALPENYIEILPTQEFNIQLPENMKTWNGDFLEPFIFYRAVILVLPKDGITCLNKLSDVSNYASFKANPNSIENVLQDFNIYYKEDIIFISSGRNIQGNLRVFDLKGTEIFEDDIYGDDIKVPFHKLPGIYIVKLETETGIYPQKIIVQ